MAFEEEEAEEGSEEELSPCSEKPSPEWSGGEMRTMHEPAPSNSQTSFRNELRNKDKSQDRGARQGKHSGPKDPADGCSLLLHEDLTQADAEPTLHRYTTTHHYYYYRPYTRYDFSTPPSACTQRFFVCD
ncbi:unnamed protein product [Boreogadus saida]